MASLDIEFCGIRSPNPFWLASAPPTDKEYNVVRAFKAGWGGVVWKTLSEAGPPLVNVSGPRYGALLAVDRSLIGFNNIELITDRALETNLEEITAVKRRWPDRALVVSIMVPCQEESWKAILPRVGAKLLPADGAPARLAAELTGAIPAGALVQLQRFPPGTRRTAQDPELAARACAALTAQPGLKLVLAPALPHPLDPPQLMDDAGAFPGHMADQRLCWLRADEAAFTAAMLEQLMTPQADQTRLRPWQAPAGGWAIVETGGDDEHRFDLAWGREEFDPRA